MKINKLLAITMVIISIMASLVGCGSAGGSSGSGDVSGSGISIYFSIPDIDDTFRAALANAIQEAASNAGASLEMEFCGSSTDDQADLISKAASSGKYNAIICRAVDTSTALQMEIAAGDLPVIFVNSEPGKTYLKGDKYVYVGSYEQDAGKYQAESIWNKLGKPSSLDIIILQGESGHPASVGRSNAVRYFFADNGVKANVVFMDTANWSDTEAYEKLDIFKITNQNFDCIFCNNDTMALGAVKWLKDHHYDLDKYPVAGVDATADGCASIAAGEMYMTVLQDAKNQGAAAIKGCIYMAKGQSISAIDGASSDLKYIWVPFVAVDGTNVKDYM